MNRHRASLFSLVGWSLCSVAACGSGTEAGVGPGHRPQVDETGYMQGNGIFYTSAGEITDSPTFVVVVGLSGTLRVPGGELTLSNSALYNSTFVSNITADGGFAAGVLGRLGDVLTLHYTAGGTGVTASVHLDNGLEVIVNQGISASQRVRMVREGPEAGTVSVDLTALGEVAPPFVVYNAVTGDTAFAEDAATPVILPASPGDSVCAFRVHAEKGPQSTNLCEPAP